MQSAREKKTPAIVIADQRLISLRGIKHFINSHFANCNVIEANSSARLKNILKTNSVTHLITDVELAESGSTNLFDNLRKTSPDLQIMVYNTQSNTSANNKKAHLQADYLLPVESSETEIIGALTFFLKNGSKDSKSLNAEVNEIFNLEIKNPFEKLSEREKIALQYLLKGYRVKDIASKMKVATNTVATFKKRIFKKLKIDNTIDLYKIAQHYLLK